MSERLTRRKRRTASRPFDLAPKKLQGLKGNICDRQHLQSFEASAPMCPNEVADPKSQMSMRGDY